MPEIVYIKVTPEEEHAAILAVLRALEESAVRLRELRERRQDFLVVKEQTEQTTVKDTI